MIRVELPYPHKDLWPNGGHGARFGVAGQKKKHKEWADVATRAACGARRPAFDTQRRIPVLLTVTRKAAGVYPDKDNCVSASKAYLDGIAHRLGVNDRLFETPVVSFLPAITGLFIFEIGEAA
ncbi:MAG: hypothetical protein KGJ57_17540 [Sphingomonadales bacterium]|nr:hypothetical protein [Sphingomonadales bacterium]MDE2171202.1 hypothetical protein [Sphingomonadales bacterium]